MDTDSKAASRKGRPNHPIDFKHTLAEQACAPGVSVAKLALAHGLNANMLFRWRREYRAGKFGAAVALKADVAAARTTALPALIPVIAPATSVPSEPQAPTASIEIVLGRVTVRVHGEVSRSALRTVLECLGVKA
ncbi:transposase [Niveibacterium sp. 24ML]|uniref:IS66-like element accessory protein TnpA n=1 Tax=Niveibacterium sp. 24ML TaxID=2985512 RepID=UPI00226E73AA|nr:transposase [Niveibacterium sp. 24ML]MCX9157275.1 transposase [Niveibacterium sp. 24ML]